MGNDFKLSARSSICTNHSSLELFPPLILANNLLLWSLYPFSHNINLTDCYLIYLFHFLICSTELSYIAYTGLGYITLGFVSLCWDRLH